MINNRQAGRRRGRGGNGGGGGGNGGGPRAGGMGRPDNGNRIDNRARGNAPQLLEKYRNLAREAQMQGDRVNTEYYLQFADHYFRVLSDQRGRDDQPRRQPQPADAFDDGFGFGATATQFDGDDDYGDEGEPIRGNEQSQPQARDERDGRRDGGQREFNQRETGQRETGQRDGRRDEQRDGQRDNGQRDNGQREAARRDEGYREGQRDGGQREGGDRPRYAEGERRPRAERPDRDAANGERRPRIDREQAMAPRVERQVEAASPSSEAALPVDLPVAANEPAVEAPRRRGRPRRETAVEQTSLDQSEAPAAFEADRLPPSLGISAVASNDTEDAPKPRRRRVRAEPPEASAAE